MANYATLKQAIQEVITTNGNNEITGAILQQTLVAIVNSLGADFQFVGVADPSTAPGTPDQNVAYIGGKGTYPNFSSATVPQDCIGVFTYNGSWTTAIIPLNISTPFVSNKLNLLLSRAELERGNISSGVNSDSVYRWRSVDYVEWPTDNDGNLLPIKYSVSNGFLVDISYYNSSKTYIYHTTYNQSGQLNAVENAKYVRFCFRRDPDTNFPESVLAGMVAEIYIAGYDNVTLGNTIKTNKKTTDNSITEISKAAVGAPIQNVQLTPITGYNVRWDGGGLSSNTNGCYTQPIPVQFGDILVVGAGAPPSVAILSKCGQTFSADNYTPILHYESTGYQENTIVIDFDGYVTLSYRTNVDGNVYIKQIRNGTAFKFYQLSIVASLVKLKVAQFNEGLMNYGSSPRGMPDDSDFNTNIMTWRRLISSFLADIYFACEHTENAKQGSTAAADKSYLLIDGHFFPYSFGNTNSVYIFSKFPLKNTLLWYTTTGDRRVAEAEIEINRKKIMLVCFHPVPGATEALAAQRLADNTELANRYAQYDYVIMGADTNAQSVDELQPFVNNGYVLGNMGFFGNIPTSQVGNPIDTIIVKGFNMDSFNVGSEKATSDHYPVMGQITTLL